MCGGDFERKICVFLKKKENLGTLFWVLGRGAGLLQWRKANDIMIHYKNLLG